MLLPDGYMSLLRKMNVPNLCLNSNVEKIETLKNDKIKVLCEGCKHWIADRVSGRGNLLWV